MQNLQGHRQDLPKVEEVYLHSKSNGLVQMISRPAMVPAVLLEQPQVRFPALSKGEPQAMQRRTLMEIGERPAKRLAMFFCSMSLTTLGGRVLIRETSGVPGASSTESPSAAFGAEAGAGVSVDLVALLGLPELGESEEPKNFG